jgi:hypothetical protein
MSTPIENHIAWAIHRAAVAAARAIGLCWWCAQLSGFVATDTPPTTPQLCLKCQATHPSPPVVHEVASCR